MQTRVVAVALSLTVMVASWLTASNVVAAPARAAHATPAQAPGAAQLPGAVTLGSLAPPPSFDDLDDLRARTRPASRAALKARRVEMESLRSRLRRTPTDPAVVKWLHRLAVLEVAEAHRAYREANSERRKMQRLAQREQQRIDRARKRYEYKLALSIRKKWRLPKKPSFETTVVVPPKAKIHLKPAIQHFETIIANHARYRRMDEVLLTAGTLRLQQGIQDRDIPGTASGEQYLSQVLFDFGWSPLASYARAHLADLALSRRDRLGASGFLTVLSEEESRPALRDYARLQLAWMKAAESPSAAHTALLALAAATPDAVVRTEAKAAAARLSVLLPKPVAPEVRKARKGRKARKARKRRKGRKR